ncbi:MAG TPA: hypothetical protein VHV83_18835 [Armatimonadota bacterium]|nr:hypothetical protein [Armatimonadota bacterium]
MAYLAETLRIVELNPLGNRILATNLLGHSWLSAIAEQSQRAAQTLISISRDNIWTPEIALDWVTQTTHQFTLQTQILRESCGYWVYATVPVEDTLQLIDVLHQTTQRWVEETRINE